MRTAFRRRFLVLGLALSAIAVAVSVGLITPGHAHPASARGTVITVQRGTTGQVIAPGFLGLSLEYTTIPAYAGTDPRAVDPVLLQLIRNLAPGQPPVLRIGGDTTDWTWSPAPDIARPAGASYPITPSWLAVTRALADDLGARLIVGINLEANSPRDAATEARALIAGLGRKRVEALELGNEPEQYGGFPWWGGVGHTGRPHGYDFADYSKDISRMLPALAHLPLAGPAIGGPAWLSDIGRFIAEEHPVVVTLHRYPLQSCGRAPSNPGWPTLAHLLAPAASRGLADRIAPSVRVSRSHGVPVRVDEMNSISCSPKTDATLAHSFASALWVLDALFQMARVGVEGVNIHTWARAAYNLFTFTHTHGEWHALVEPEYYGMLMFAQAAPAGSHLLRISWRPHPAKGVRVWATRASNGRVRVVLIDVSRRSHTVALRVPAATGTGTLERLTAPRLRAVSGVTLGGRSFGAQTSSGRLGRPEVTRVRAIAGSYSLRLPAASAAMLTLT